MRVQEMAMLSLGDVAAAAQAEDTGAEAVLSRLCGG